MMIYVKIENQDGSDELWSIGSKGDCESCETAVPGGAYRFRNVNGNTHFFCAPCLIRDEDVTEIRIVKSPQ